MTTVPNFSLRQLGYLVAVADHGSMTAAAEAIHVSQASISVAVNDLERRLGAQLMVRHPGYGISLTEAGADVVADARRVLAAASDLYSAARSPGHDLHGQLALGCFSTIAPLFVPPLYETFAREHPAVRLDVTEGGQEDLCRLVLTGKCEMALTYGNDLVAGLQTKIISRLRPYVLLAADHRLAKQEAINLHDLKGEPLIVYTKRPSPSNAERILSDAGVPYEVGYSSENIEVVRALVGRGIGWTILLQKWPSTSIDGLPLAAVPLYNAPTTYNVVVIWSTGSTLSPRSAAVVEVLRSVARGLEAGAPT
ncbi:LysR family transcriptional regulator [Streptomyces acidicola]|uniref:LysR family transcriptional regulator n=1 Tax=Streptomyces acidicola TaxID=2596892 RepID=UPI003824C982